MSRITNYEAVADFAGHWLHRAQVSLLTGKIGQIKLSHIRKNPGAGLARASLARGCRFRRAPPRPPGSKARFILETLNAKP